MIRHIVLWKFLETAGGCIREENLRTARSMLLSLKEKIPEIRQLEVGLVERTTEESFDLALNSLFDSREALTGYQKHPEHVRVVGFLRTVQSGKTVADFVIETE